MKCPFCKKIIPDDSKFCPDCGNPIKGPSVGSASSGESIADTLDFTVGGVSFKMILVEHGEFMMGATEDQEDPFDDEKPAHKVKLTNDFYIGETPVTQALWRAVMNNNPSSFGEGGGGSYEDDWEALPVECVSWNDCQRFIRNLNRMTDTKFRMPTEAEWEFAARGGNDSCGCQFSGSDYLDDVAWYGDNSYGETHPVKGLKPNELGIYDMSGNVWEWCSDWWKDGYNSSHQTNPQGPKSGSGHVYRGGGWCGSARCCRLSCRCEYSPDDASRDLGFRLALSE